MPRAYTHQCFKTPNHLQQFITSLFLCCNRLNYLQLIHPTNLVPFFVLEFSRHCNEQDGSEHTAKQPKMGFLSLFCIAVGSGTRGAGFAMEGLNTAI